MKWYKATNQQLETIFNHEANNQPNHLLVGLVEEMITRKLFDGMIIQLVKKLMSNYDRSEVLQAGYIGLYQLAKIYNNKKLSFKDMCFIAIERRIKSIQQKQYQKNNFMNAQALNHEVPIMMDSQNVERTVINHLTLEEQLGKLSKKERYIVDRFLEGYSIAYIAIHEFKQDAKAIHYHFNKALKKMNITDYKIGARSGLKGA